jgi:hypothetical protein
VHAAEAAGFCPGGPPVSEEQWRELARGWFPSLSGTRLRQPSWQEIAPHHERIAGLLGVVPVSVICQRLHDEEGLEASVASVRRYVHRHFPEHGRQAGVEVRRPPSPPGEEAQVDYGYLGTWSGPRAGRRRRVWAFSMVLHICVNCYKMPTATCSICGRHRECNFAATARPVCISCSPRATATCARCGQDRPPAARWPEGPACDPCYTAALRHRGRCASCGKQRRLVTPPGPAADTCADCAGIPVTHACTDCGTEGKLYEKDRCARCSLRRRARDLLSAGTGIVPAQLGGVLDAVTAARQPRSALNWLRKGAGAGLLADAAAGRLAISHEALDAHPHRRAAGYLRHMLTAGGALPPRDEELAHAGQWLAAVLETIEPAADRRLVQAYATWQVMRRLRASAARTARPRTPTAHARNNIRAAASLLAWLRSRGTELAACGQADIDQWLHTRPSACLARDFLAWAAARGHCQQLSIPAPPRATGSAISQDQRWALTARLLHDTTLDPTDRVAGCLLLLYGQPLSRIAAITTGQVTRRDDQTFIQLGRHDAPAPAPLASAVSQLISGGRSYRGIGSPPATTWLFPGHLPGRPITPARLGERLRAIGIYAQTGRRAALLDLAAQLPAAVLADLLGLHETTAAKWMHQAGGDWSRYAAELARSRPHQT